MLERNISCVQTMEWFCFIEVSVDSQSLWYFFENLNIWKLILVIPSGGIVGITPFFAAGIRPHTSALKLGCYARLNGFKIKF